MEWRPDEWRKKKRWRKRHFYLSLKIAERKIHTQTEQHTQCFSHLLDEIVACRFVHVPCWQCFVLSLFLSHFRVFFSSFRLFFFFFFLTSSYIHSFSLTILTKIYLTLFTLSTFRALSFVRSSFSVFFFYHFNVDFFS